jgi:hypothetical protein
MVAHVELVEAQLVGQDVLHVVIHHAGCLQTALFVVVGNTGGTGDARTHGEDLAPRRLRPGRRDLRVFRPRTHQAHLADQHVP